MFLLIMKVFLFCAVAVWVVAATVDRPCADYCVYLSSDNQDIKMQSGCDCIDQEYQRAYQNQGDHSSIYVEPVNYSPQPVYIHNQPIYILNPLFQGRQTNGDRVEPIKPYPVKPKTLEPPLRLQVYDTDIEINANHAQSSNNRHEKDIQSKEQKTNAPLYLDIYVESENIESLASTKAFTAEQLNLTQERLLECTNLYTALHPKKNIDTKGAKIANLKDEYRKYSNEELKNIMKDKCSHISYIVEESQNEIKKARFKLTSVIHGGNQLNDKGSHLNNINYKTEDSLCTVEDSLHSSVENESSGNENNEYKDNHEQTAVTQSKPNATAFDLNTTPNNLIKLREISTSTPSPSTNTDKLSGDDIQMSSDIYTSTQEVSTDARLIYILNETTTTRPIAMNSEASTFYDMTTASTTEHEIIKEQNIDQESKLPAVEGSSVNRQRYVEGEVPLVKIVTQEFSNDTVQSNINGTEKIPNGDFDDESEKTEIGQSLASRSGSKTTSSNESFEITAPDISGNLYFLFNKQHHIPAKFVQKSNGSLYIGIDGITLCNTLTENGELNSLLLSNLCNCYKTGNCTKDESDYN